MSHGDGPGPGHRLTEPANAGSSALLERAAYEHGFELDSAQRAVAPYFQRLYEELQATERASAVRRLFGRRQRVRGLYLWGAVGRGKSFLMDAFFRFAPVQRKHRAHFHRFMQSVHHGLRALQGQAEPLQVLAHEYAERTRLLCLDELQVTDIGDAMLMRGLLEALFARDVVLVTTSNQRPDRLYEHGLQRAQFLPAIELIQQSLEVVELAGRQDYRLQALERAGMYHWPQTPQTLAVLERAFLDLAGEPGESEAEVEIDSRRLRTRRLAPGVVWFEFAELCDGPRGTADYIELARRYHTVLVSGVPAFRSEKAESMRRFTWLVDEFYDRQVKLMIAADVALDELYAPVPLTSETERASSRLVEMQSTRYLSLPHLA